MRLEFLMLTIFVVLFLSFTIKAQMHVSVTISTQPKAKVWINDVFWGITNDKGEIVLRDLPAGTKKLRIRATGFKEANFLLNLARKNLKVDLERTDDKAELTFQQAEDMVSSDRQKAIELYQQAISLNTKYTEAYIGLARALPESGYTEQALEAISKARRIRPIYPEVSAVEGRVHKAEGNRQKAVASFLRAIREGKGFQPEAYVGLGLLYQEKAEEFGSEGDFERERKTYNLAAYHLRKAIKQLAGAPDAVVIYQILGVIYERQGKYNEAIKLYEEFLEKFPESNEREAIESFIVQIRKKIKEQDQ